MAKIRKFAYIFRGDGFAGERAVMDSGEFRATIVAVPKVEDACGVAKQLVAEGVELIDLCGAFHRDDALKVSEAVDGVIRIAYVSSEIPAKK